MATEIYLCKKGQAIKEGRLVYTDDINDKHAAKRDAAERCEEDKYLHKVAYYKVDPNGGEHQVFYTYTNPDALASPSKPKPKIKKTKGGAQGGKRLLGGGEGVAKKISNWLYDGK